MLPAWGERAEPGSRVRGEGVTHESNGGVEVVADEGVVEPEDADAEAGEDAVAAGIGGGAKFVIIAVDFDDQASGGSEEVSDEAACERNLTAEGDAELAAREAGPEQSLAGGHLIAHATSALSEERAAMGGGAGASRHGRAEARGDCRAQPDWRRPRDAPGGRAAHGHAMAAGRRRAQAARRAACAGAQPGGRPGSRHGSCEGQRAENDSMLGSKLTSAARRSGRSPSLVRAGGVAAEHTFGQGQAARRAARARARRGWATQQKGGVHPLRVTLEREAKASPPAAGGAEPKGSEPVGPVGDEGKTGGGNATRTAVIIGGAALTAIGAGFTVGFVLAKSSAQSDADSALASAEKESGPAPCKAGGAGSASCRDLSDALDRRDKYGTLADVALVSTGVFAVTTVGALLLWPRQSEKNSARVRVAPVLSGSRTGFVVSGSF